jgi:RNA polymerase sigma-70 factor (ECF subfamily)
MDSDMANNPNKSVRAVPDIPDTCPEQLAQLFEQRRTQLRRMVALRLDHRLQGRIDPSDVIQEAYLEASVRLGDYQKNPAMPLFVWLRFITAQKLLVFHRRHLGAQVRDAGREVSLYRGALPEATSAALAAQLVGRYTTPSQAAMRAELRLRVQDALNLMDPMDREILALRHFEQLSNAEAAHVLEIDESAASKRFVRALHRLKEILASFPGGLAEL